MVKRIIAIIVIFACSLTAWALLSFVINMRTEDRSGVMRDAVGELWGTEHTQVAPQVTAQWTTVSRREVKRVGSGWEFIDEDDAAQIDGTQLSTKPDPSTRRVVTELVSRKIVTEKATEEEQQKSGKATASKKKKKGEEESKKRSFEVTEERHTVELALGASDVRVDLDVDHRKKGLLWFATYAVDFGAEYLLENPIDQAVMVQMAFPFPSHDAVYDNMKVLTEGRDNLGITTESGQMIARFTLPAGATQPVGFGYRSRGMDRWNYRFGTEVKIVENFKLEMSTDFDEIDFPAGTISPDAKQQAGEGQGWQLVWDKDSLVSGLEIGMAMPQRINPGPLAEAMSLHAPVSLFFFFFVIFILQVLKDIRIHPMNYFFIAAAFFAFNLLFSYLVDHLDIFLSFGIASLVSIALVVMYLRLVVGARFALVEAGISQLVYQGIFSLAHFWEGYTGLTVTIGAILTLAIVMIATGRIDWFTVFKSKREQRIPAPEPQGSGA
ncbi:MAG: inner membrane CreD family protein [Deltaproteobacteria bacterium]|nr:inner membrane CreD family protein [Deltaproteobacteria bacterium]